MMLIKLSWLVFSQNESKNELLCELMQPFVMAMQKLRSNVPQVLLALLFRNVIRTIQETSKDIPLLQFRIFHFLLGMLHFDQKYLHIIIISMVLMVRFIMEKQMKNI
jgi:hypothetical protein